MQRCPAKRALVRWLILYTVTTLALLGITTLIAWFFPIFGEFSITLVIFLLSEGFFITSLGLLEFSEYSLGKELPLRIRWRGEWWMRLEFKARHPISLFRVAVGITLLAISLYLAFKFVPNL